ncbi:MAG: RDD family protein [Nitrospirae bacterium]|nr:RDD family protein [Nitrospirota bacterium]
MKDVKGYYQTLGLGVDASVEEVKHAYRDLAKVWHPDRFTHDPALQKKAEAKLAEINIAYSSINSHLKEEASKKDAKSTSVKTEGSAHTAYKTERPFSTTDKETKTAQADAQQTQKSQSEKPQPHPRKTVAEEGKPYSLEPRPWFRFWARYFDLVVIGILVFFTMGAISPELARKANPMIFIAMTLPLWFVIEAVVMSTFGTTPGKSILSIRVRGGDGAIPGFNVFFKRGMFIWFVGNYHSELREKVVPSVEDN